MVVDTLVLFVNNNVMITKLWIILVKEENLLVWIVGTSFTCSVPVSSVN